MPARTTPITKIHRLAGMFASEIPLSTRYMAKSLNLSRTTIDKYRLRIYNSGFSVADFAALSSSAMQRILKGSELKNPSDRFKNLLSVFPELERCMLEGHSNLRTTWAEYRKNHTFGYGFSQFAAHFHSWQLTHGAGGKSTKAWTMPNIPEDDLPILLKWRRSNNRILWAKAVAILDSHEGITIASLCIKLEKSHRIIDRWIKTYCENGLDGLRSPQERIQNPLLAEDIKKKRDRIIEILHESPQLHNVNRASWSLVTLAQAYEVQHSAPIGKSTISEYIRAEGYSFRKARRVLTSPDPDYRIKLQKITQILSTLGNDEKFFSIDEFGPFAVKMQGGRTYTPNGMSRVVPQWQSSRGHLILTGALELSTNQVTHFYSEKKNTHEMTKLLEILLEQYSNQRCLYLSWDAASWHISAMLAKRVKEVNATAERAHRGQPFVKLAPLPSSAQFLNVIESVFSGMAKAVLHNSDYQTVEECKAAIDTYVKDRNLHYMQYPKRAGNKIWGKELVEPSFKSSNNCKNPGWR